MTDPVNDDLTPYYADVTATLYRGDALSVLPSIPDQSATVILLDPPYAMVPVTVRGKDDGAAGTSGAPIRLLTETLRHTSRILAPGGIAAMVCDWRRLPDLAYLASAAGLRLTTCVAWTRTTIGTGGLFRSAWDPVLIASKGSPTVVDRAGIPNVVQANPPHRRSHPYQKPTELWAHLLQRVPPGTVLDPFTGSGSSLGPTLAHGSRWIGVEVDTAHCEAIVKRLAEDKTLTPASMPETQEMDGQTSLLDHLGAA